MAPSRGLATNVVTLKLFRWAALLAIVVTWGLHVSKLVAGPPFHLLLIHTLTLCLIALAVYSWSVFPSVASVVISGAVLVSTLAAWVLTRSMVVGCDALALVLLVGFAGVQQRRRNRRLLYLKRQGTDMGESVHLKVQSLQVATQNQASLQRKLSRYQQLHSIAEQLSRLLGLEAVAQLAVDRAFELIGKSSVCLLFLVDKERQELALYASQKAEGLVAVRTKQGDQFDRYVLRTHRPLLVNDVRRDFRFSMAGSDDRTIGSVIACPLLVGQSAEGVLRLDSPEPQAYSQDDLRFLDILLDLVDTAVANARLFGETQQLAVTDGLTGLFRRQPFLEQLTREVARAQRGRETLVVVMLDIDDFKQYNDTFGHSAGDLVLRSVADILRSAVPPDAMCGRYGGEEMTILLPKASRAQGDAVAQSIRHLVEAKVRAVGDSSQRAVTVSLGVASFPDDAATDLELIRRADQRLYEAKRLGKNRVVSEWSQGEAGESR